MGLFSKKPQNADADAEALESELATVLAVARRYPAVTPLTFGVPTRCPQCGNFGFVESVNQLGGVCFNHCFGCRINWVITVRALRSYDKIVANGGGVSGAAAPGEVDAGAGYLFGTEPDLVAAGEPVGEFFAPGRTPDPVVIAAPRDEPVVEPEPALLDRRPTGADRPAADAAPAEPVEPAAVEPAKPAVNDLASWRIALPEQPPAPSGPPPALADLRAVSELRALAERRAADLDEDLDDMPRRRTGGRPAPKPVRSAASEPASAATVAPEPAMPATPIRLLVVEDNPFDYAVLEGLFSDPSTGIVAVHAATLGEAVARAEAGFDVVLLDLNLPDTTGVATILEWQHRTGGSVPVLAMSATSDPEVVRAARATGVAHFVPKHQIEELTGLGPAGTARFVTLLQATIRGAAAVSSAVAAEDRART